MIVVDNCVLFGSITEVACDCVTFVKIVASDFLIKCFEAPLSAFMINSELKSFGWPTCKVLLTVKLFFYFTVYISTFVQPNFSSDIIYTATHAIL